MNEEVKKTTEKPEKSLEEMTYQELKKKAKELKIEVIKGDNREILIEKIKAYLANMASNIGQLVNVRRKMSQRRKVIVTKLNPEDTREATIVTITNATGTYQQPVIFNTPMELPIPVIKELKNRKYQAFRRVKDPLLGMKDVPYETKAYNVQEVD